MEQTIEGKIVSKDLGVFGKQQIVYGYLGIEKTDGTQIKVKVDSFTWYETLDIGSNVFVETHKLGSTDILVAKRIDVNQEPMNLTKREASIHA
jgi:hypothetical protein